MGVPAESFKTCNYCGEMIQAAAVKCRHCGELLDPNLRAQQQAMMQPPPVQQHFAAAHQPPPQVFVHTPVHVASYQQVVAYRRPFNHLLHLVLTVVTCGAWLPVWITLWLIYVLS